MGLMKITPVEMKEWRKEVTRGHVNPSHMRRLLAVYEATEKQNTKLLALVAALDERKSAEEQLSKTFLINYVSQGKDGWHIIDPESGAMTTMTPSEFSKRMILESQCPPQVQNLFDAMPHYSAWKFNHEHNYQPQTR